MSKGSGGDFGPLNALGMVMAIGGVALLGGLGVLAYQIGGLMTKEIIQQAMNICGIATIAIFAIVVFGFIILVQLRGNRGGYGIQPPAQNYDPQISYVPPHLLTGQPLPPPPPHGYMLDTPEDERGHIELASADRQFANKMREDQW